MKDAKQSNLHAVYAKNNKWALVDFYALANSMNVLIYLRSLRIRKLGEMGEMLIVS